MSRNENRHEARGESQKQKNVPELSIHIFTRADADNSLKAMGALKDSIAKVEIEQRAIIRAAEEKMESFTCSDRIDLAANEAALEQWAKANYYTQFDGSSRTLSLTFGKLSFRLTPPSIRQVRKIKTVIEWLKAKKEDDELLFVGQGASRIHYRRL